MSISTKYLGLTLNSPIIVGSSGLTDNVEKVVQCYENGAGAVVLKSIFEEQIINTIHDKHYSENKEFQNTYQYFENLANDEIIENHINLIKESKKQTKIPIIASINCVTSNVWYYFAQKLEDAGADAFELVVNIPAMADYASFDQLISAYFNIIENVTKNISIPISIKISSNFPNYRFIVSKFEEMGINGIVLFNRPYTPDIDINNMSIISKPQLSNSTEIINTLRWIALLSSKTKMNLCGSTGVHKTEDIIKLILVGADCVQVSSTLFLNGIEYLNTLNNELKDWLKIHNIDNIQQIRGKIIKDSNYNADFERTQYIKRVNS